MLMTLKQASKVYDIPKKYLLNLYYTDRDQGRTDRFIVEDGVIKVCDDFKCPHREDIENLFLRALESTSGNEKAIAKLIAEKTGKKINTVYMYLRNYKFKNHIFAQQVMNILKEYINTHNLFANLQGHA